MKPKWILDLILIALIIGMTGLFGCGKSTETIKAEGANFDIPTSWTRMDSSHDIEYNSADYNFSTLIYDYMEYEGSATDTLNKEVDGLYGSSYRNSKVLQDDVTVDGESGITYSYYSLYDDSTDEPYLEGVQGFHIDVFAIHDDHLYRFLFRTIKKVDDESNDIEKETFSIMKKILKTVTFEEVDETPLQQ
jgi:hypothetical protein